MGAYLSQPVTTKESDAGSNDWLKFAGSAMQGWRRSMEDAHILGSEVDDATVFAVFDGHGGAEVARFVARHLVDELPKSWTQEPEKALKRLFHKMDDLLREPDNAKELAELKNGGPRPAAAEDEEEGSSRRATTREALELFQQMMLSSQSTPNAETEDDDDDKPVVPQAVVTNGRRHCALPDHPVQAGCTAVVVLASQRQQRLYCANAGDSRAVLSRQGVAVPLSKDHKPNDETEEARVVNAGGFVECANGFFRINGNLNLSRSIGDLKYKGDSSLDPAAQIITAEPDVLAIDVDPSKDDFFVVACDGVFDVLSSQELVDFIHARLPSTSLTEICEQVFDRCIAQNPRETRGIGGDNMTCVIVQFYQP